MFCPNCGTQLPNNARACSRCGVAVEPFNPAAFATEKAKAASKDAWLAFKTFAADPVGGLSVAFDSLGQARALSAGIAFAALVALCLLFGAYRLLPVWGQSHGFGGLARILVMAVAPGLFLFGACVLGRKAFRGVGGLEHDAFVAGASLLPLGLVALLAGVVGPTNMEMVTAAALFALCLTVLVLFAGLTRIYKTSEPSAAFAVPLMVVASAWLSKVVWLAMLKEL